MRTKFGALSLAGVAIVVLVGASFPSTDLSNALALGAGVVGSRETAEIDRPLEPGTKATPVSVAGVGALPAIGRFPSFDGATGWINSPALRRDDLKGKVVLVNFWTYACGDCVSALPRITSWTEKFGKDGLVVVGVHSPEFAFEKDRSGLERAVKGMISGIRLRSTTTIKSGGHTATATGRSSMSSIVKE